MSHLARELAVQQLQQLDRQARLIVVHPNYTGQHSLLNAFLEGQPAAYVRFDGDGLTGTQLQQQLHASLTTQLNPLKLNRVKRLALDECDRALPDDLTTLLVDILSQIQDGMVMVISRKLPLVIYQQPEFRSHIRVIPAERTLMLPDYARHDDRTTLLEVQAFGSGRVLVNGRVIETWDGVLPRALFFFLIDRGMTTRSEIFDTFWPGVSTREATNVFHVTKRKINEILGVDMTVYRSGFYHLSAQVDLNYDVALFNEQLQHSELDVPIPDRERVLATAVALYRNDFLTTISMEWTRRRRQELLQNYGEALAGLAKLNEQIRQPDHALGLYLRAHAANPQREDLVRNIMQLYRGMGLYADALHVYDQLKAELHRTLGVSPAQVLQQLAADIQRTKQ
jgi:DNA-binding SARP family transcriptional activator